MGLSVIAGLMVAGCGSEEGPVSPPANKAPTIQFTFDKIAVGAASEVALTVAVADADGDPLTVDWAITRGGNPSGFLISGQGTPVLTWEAPSTPGVDVAAVTVSDGKGGQQMVTETLKVGTVETADVATSQTWILSRSPYIIRPTNSTIFAVDATAVLTVSQGVEIFIDKAAVDFQIQGAILTLGTSGAPVIMQPNSRNPSPGDWKGVSAVPSSSAPIVDLNFTRISHAQNAVRTTGGVSTAFVNGCTISQCNAAAILHESTGSLSVTNSFITNNKMSGIRVERGIGAAPPAAVTIEGDSIATNGELTSPNGVAGISLIFNDPSALVPVSITGNTISRNFIPGISLGSPAPAVAMALFPTISNNNINGNEFGKATAPRLNILLQDGFNGVPATIDARNNWWGQAFAPGDSTTIRDGIWDLEDSFGAISVMVTVTPWLTAAP